MIRLSKIDSALFPKLYHSFLIDDDPLSDAQDWKNVFDYQFDNEEGYCGYAMLDDGEVVGMLGMVFARRDVDGETRKFCNLHTWWVREDHRGRSLALLRPVLSLDGYTITHFTPCDIVRAITKRMGFEDLSTQLRILLPNSRLAKRRGSGCSLTFEASEFAAELDATDKQILADHLPYGVGHLLVRSNAGSCYVLYTHVVRHRLPYCHIHYVSDRQSFEAMEAAVRAALLSRHEAKFVAIDTRLVQGLELASSFDFWAPAHGLYKSPDLSPDRIDNLYSDVVFLKLTTLPDMTHELRQIVKRYGSKFAINRPKLRRAG